MKERWRSARDRRELAIIESNRSHPLNQSSVRSAGEAGSTAPVSIRPCADTVWDRRNIGEGGCGTVLGGAGGRPAV